MSGMRQEAGYLMPEFKGDAARVSKEGMWQNKKGYQDQLEQLEQ